MNLTETANTVALSGAILGLAFTILAVGIILGNKSSKKK
jgi:hypothetical protein